MSALALAIRPQEEAGFERPVPLWFGPSRGRKRRCQVRSAYAIRRKEFEGFRKGPKCCARFLLTTLRSVISSKLSACLSGKDERYSFDFSWLQSHNEAEMRSYLDVLPPSTLKGNQWTSIRESSPLTQISDSGDPNKSIHPAIARHAC
jgi:hypothetical protein